MLCVAGKSQAVAQDASEVRVAVVDMQHVLNEYYKTKVETGKLNILIERRQKKITELIEGQKERIENMGVLKKKLDDTAVAKSAKKNTAKAYELQMKVIATRGQELKYHRQKASVEIATAQAEMEKILLVEIKKEMKAVIAANGVDLVFDKSFLPKASKAIIHTSAKINDLSERIITSLNAMAPVAVPAP